jgi:hypothetical protein
MPGTIYDARKGRFWEPINFRKRRDLGATRFMFKLGFARSRDCPEHLVRDHWFRRDTDKA